LYILDSKEEKFAKERELVNEELLQDPLCMNANIGGSGGSPKGRNKGIIRPPFTTEHCRALSESKKGKPSWNKGLKGCSGQISPMKNKYRSLEDREKISIKTKEAMARPEVKERIKGKIPWCKGIKRPEHSERMKGTVWITNGIETKMIKEENQIPTGWKKGRKNKK
jgi:hypothetical protein